MKSNQFYFSSHKFTFKFDLKNKLVQIRLKEILITFQFILEE